MKTTTRMSRSRASMKTKKLHGRMKTIHAHIKSRGKRKQAKRDSLWPANK